MRTSTNIIKVGNSNGIIIPSSFLKALRLKEKDKVEISESNGVISIRRKEKLGETPFSLLDKWNEEHGYASASLEEIRDYVENLRSARTDKEIVTW